MAAVCEITASLPDPALPLADWADRYSVELAKPVAARAFMERAFATQPAWIAPLMHLRDRLANLAGLKAVHRQNGIPAIAGFPIVAEQENRLVLGFDDWHLNFRIVIETSAVAPFARITTLVQRHNLFGRLYILAITPFHRAIVRAMLRRAGDDRS